MNAAAAPDAAARHAADALSPEETTLGGTSSLRRDFVWLAAANVVYALCQWGMLMAIARLGTAEMLGRFALGLAVGAPVVMFLSVQLRALLATDARREFLFRDYFALRLATAFLGVGVTAAAALVAGYESRALAVIIAVAVAKALEAVSDVVYGLLQQRGRMDRLAVSRIVKGVLSLLALALALKATGDLVTAVMAMAAVWGLVLVIYDLPTAAAALRADPGDRLMPRWRSDRQRSLVRQALPLGFVMLLISLNANIPRYFVEALRGEGALGVFAALGYVIVAGTQVMIALWQAASPRLARHFAARDTREFMRLMRRLTLVALGAGALGWLVAQAAGVPLLKLFYGPDYAVHAPLLNVLMVAAALLYLSSLLGHALTAVRQIDVQLSLSLVFAAATLAACALLVPAHGLAGAVWAVLVAAAVQLPPKAWLLARTLRGSRS